MRYFISTFAIAAMLVSGAAFAQTTVPAPAKAKAAPAAVSVNKAETNKAATTKKVHKHHKRHARKAGKAASATAAAKK